MCQPMGRKILKKLLSPWALIPCLLLLLVTYFILGLAMMQADEFNRELNSIETALSLTPVIPILWLLLIVGAWVFGKIKNKVT